MALSLFGCVFGVIVLLLLGGLPLAAQGSGGGAGAAPAVQRTLVLGVGRSGTSLVAAIANQRDAKRGPSVLWFEPCFDHALNIFAVERRYTRCEDVVRDAMQCTLPQTGHNLRLPEAYCRVPGAAIVVKSIRMDGQFVEPLLRRFPNLRVLFVQRHPFAVIRSQKASFKKREPLDHIAKVVCTRTDMYRRVYESLKQRPELAHRVALLRYESVFYDVQLFAKGIWAFQNGGHGGDAHVTDTMLEWLRNTTTSKCMGPDADNEVGKQYTTCRSVDSTTSTSAATQIESVTTDVAMQSKIIRQCAPVIRASLKR